MILDLLSQNEIYDAVFEFYNNFLFNSETKYQQHLNYKSTFSYYLKNSKYSETYIKNRRIFINKNLIINRLINNVWNFSSL